MREHETSAPSLGSNPSDGALKVARQNGGEDGELVERIAWMLEPEAFQIWEREYQAKSGAKMRGPTWDQLAVSGRREKARETAASIVAGPLAGRLIDPTAMAEAVASARAKGVREGLERAATLSETHQIAAGTERFVFAGHVAKSSAGDEEFIGLSVARSGMQSLTAAIRALIPGGSSDV